jgi:hypothetical protein
MGADRGRRVGLTGSGGLFVKRLVLWTASAVVSCSSLAVVVGSPAATAGPVSTAGISGRFLPAPGPRHIHAAPGVSATPSTNWSGYVQQTLVNGTFTEVSDTVVVPTVVAGKAGEQYAADWVGIGGAITTDSTLVQDGIQTIVTKRGRKTNVSYGAWTEVLPKPEDPLTLTVSAGDTVTSTVWESDKNEWTMTVDDVTTGKSQSRTVPYTSKGLSAEAIHERPCIRGQCDFPRDLAALAHTTNVTFGPGSLSEAAPGATPVPEPLLGSVNGATLTEIVMTNNRGTQNIATPSAPDADNEAFAVAYGAVAPAAPTP